MPCIAICSLCGCSYIAAEETEDGVCVPCLLAACDKGLEYEEMEVGG